MKAFNEYLRKSLEDKEFSEIYEKTSLETNLGLSLTLRREELGYTQKIVSEKTGIKQPMLARIERGQVPNPGTLQKLAKALEICVIFTGEKIAIQARNIENSAIESDLVFSDSKHSFKTESKTELQLSNVFDFSEYKQKLRPLTVSSIDKYEENYESVQLAAK